MKRYMIEHTPTCGSINVTISDTYERDGVTFNTIDNIQNMVDFWTGSERRLRYNNNDYTVTFLKQLCEAVMRLTAHENLNLRGVLRHFAEDAEGYSDMNGSFGIEITDVCSPEMSEERDFEISELK